MTTTFHQHTPTTHLYHSPSPLFFFLIGDSVSLCSSIAGLKA